MTEINRSGNYKPKTNMALIRLFFLNRRKRLKLETKLLSLNSGSGVLDLYKRS